MRLWFDNFACSLTLLSLYHKSSDTCTHFGRWMHVLNYWIHQMGDVLLIMLGFRGWLSDLAFHLASNKLVISSCIDYIILSLEFPIYIINHFSNRAYAFPLVHDLNGPLDLIPNDKLTRDRCPWVCGAPCATLEVAWAAPWHLILDGGLKRVPLGLLWAYVRCLGLTMGTIFDLTLLMLWSSLCTAE